MRLTVPVVLLSIALVVAGCGPSSGSGDASDAQPSEETLEIAVIPKGTTHEFWKSIHAGAEKAASEFDVEVIWQGPQKEDDRQMQIQVVQNFISRGVDAIVLAPLDARSMVGPVEAAVRRGIPVIIIDSGLDSEAQTSFIATNNYEGGRMGGRYLAELIGGEGNVVMLRYQEGSASTTNREEGFLSALEEYAPEAELLVSNMYAGATMERALQVSQNILNRFSEIDGIWTPNESSTQGMLRALQTSGRAGEIEMVGFDVNETLLSALREGTLDGLVVQDPFAMGYEGVAAAVAAVRGEAVEDRVDTRSVLVTRENIDDPDIQELLHPDLDRWLAN
ncbi:MAG: substrate-binding domain-containing protein [Rhodothermales bacterium]